MAYTEKLIEEIKILYPDSTTIIASAENGSAWLGKYLYDELTDGIPIDQILSSTSLDDLKEKAKLIQKKQALYKKWCEQDPRKFS